MVYGSAASNGKVDAVGPVGGGVQIGRQQREGESSGDKVDDDATVGVAVGGAVEERAPVRRVRDVGEEDGAGGGVCVAGVCDGVTKCIEPLEGFWGS